jgi:hypothetical protein
MSLTAFKNKSVIQYGSKRSGKPPGGIWLPQGPFGRNTLVLKESINSYGAVGFSLNGPHRNVGYVGQSMRMSKNGTPFRGLYPLGSGGTYGQYVSPEPSYNVNEVLVEGTQHLYVKPTVLTTYGMLQKKYKWAYNGQYPNNWVQPNYAGTNQAWTKSQGNYIDTLSSANDCVIDINAHDKYIGYIRNGGSTLCHTSTQNFTYDDMARNGLYTKFIYNPIDSSQYTRHSARKCNNPTGATKPFPFATNGSTCFNTIFLTPPKWYTNPKNKSLQA